MPKKKLGKRPGVFALRSNLEHKAHVYTSSDTSGWPSPVRPPRHVGPCQRQKFKYYHKKSIKITMAYDCGAWFAKSLLCLFNFIFFICGTVVLGVGIWLAADKASFIKLLHMVDNENVEQFTQSAVIEQMAYVLIVCGALIFLLSFLGYCGALKESPCLLTTYGILLILILITQLTLGGLAAAYKERTRAETKSYLQSTITKYYSTGEKTDAVSLMWNHLMTQLSCCGVDNYRDFQSSESWIRNKGNRSVPEACCIYDDLSVLKLRDPQCPQEPSSSNSYINKGCYQALTDWIILHRNIIIIVAIGIGLVELFAIFLAFCLCKTIDKYRGLRL